MILFRYPYSNTIYRCIISSSSIRFNILDRSTFQQNFRLISSNEHLYTKSQSFIQNSKSFNSIRSFSKSSCRLSSIVPFKLADIGEGIRDVEVKEWYVGVGDHVKQFDKICEVHSDKANVTIISRYDGTIVKLYYNVSDIARVGQPLVDIQLPLGVDLSLKNKPATIMQEDNFDKPILSKNPLTNILVTPTVRQMAKKLQISLNDVQGTGKDGRILKEDLIGFQSKTSSTIAPPSPISGKTSFISRPAPIPSSSSLKSNSLRSKTKPIVFDRKESIKEMNQTIIEANSIPHLTYSEQYNITNLIKLIKKLDKKVSYFSFIIKICSLVLNEYPILNSHFHFQSQTINYKFSHHISITINTKNGLFIPNIKNVQQLSILQIENELNRLQQLANNQKLSDKDLTGATFSLLNLGLIGGTYTIPLLRSPEVAIGGLGKILREAIPKSDEDEENFYRIESIISISWSADHRVIDGATIARFSNQFKYFIENPFHILIN